MHLKPKRYSMMTHQNFYFFSLVRLSTYPDTKWQYIEPQKSTSYSRYKKGVVQSWFGPVNKITGEIWKRFNYSSGKALFWEYFEKIKGWSYLEYWLWTIFLFYRKYVDFSCTSYTQDRSMDPGMLLRIAGEDIGNSHWDSPCSTDKNWPLHRVALKEIL